jgi:branched-chain amino acid transport system ATP-binding protein
MTASTSSYALEVVNLKKAFGGLTVTQNVSLSIRPGERRLIIGPNGAGKTTLFNQISGDLRPNSGAIRLFGSDITHLPPHRRAHFGLSRTYQIITLFSLAASRTSDFRYCLWRTAARRARHGTRTEAARPLAG